MDKNATLVNFVLKNSHMGVTTVNMILKISKSEEFNAYLREQLEDYATIYNESVTWMEDNGFNEDGLSTFEEIRTYLMINMQTLTDKSVEHLASMMFIGSAMGIAQCIRKKREYCLADNKIVKLMDNLRKLEEDNLEKLKKFL